MSTPVSDKLVTVAGLKEAYDALTEEPFVVDITSGQWSGSGSDYYITVTASNITANSILVVDYDKNSQQYLKGPVWAVPAAGSFTIHTSAVPSGTVKILVRFPGTMGEANYQVLADVYSKSQTYSKTEAVAKADIVNNLTSGGATVPLSAEMAKLANTSEDHQITRVGSYFTERSAFKARRLWGTVIIFSYVQITTQVPASTAFADIGISNAEGIFSFVSGGTSHIVTCSGGILKPDEALPTGYYYVVGSALARYT